MSIPTFQEILRRLSLFWEQQGCIIHQGYDLEVGAGTFNPATFLRCLGPEPYKAAFIEPCRRPTDGRYGTNPNRLQHYFQYQVILKPSPPDIQEMYLRSLEAIGFDLKEHDIRFVHDDWEGPTLGAWGLGWEVWMDGMEVTQFTYFQCMAGLNLKPVTGEITYGIERLAMYLQGVNTIFDLQWNDSLTYGDIYHRNEVEWSHYNFEEASTEMWFSHFDQFEKEAKKLIARNLPLPAYDFVLKASHAFNILDARGVISVSERTGYIGRIRDLARAIAESYLKSREEQGFPLLKKQQQQVKDKGEPAPLTIDKSVIAIDSDKKEDCLIEIGSEELPALFVPIGCTNLEKGLKQLLTKEGLKYDQLTCTGTPRRLVAYIQGLAQSRPATKVERRGPSVQQAFDDQGRCAAAGEGFFRSIGKAEEKCTLQMIRENRVTGVTITEIKGVEYLVATLEVPGRAAIEILSEQLPKLILDIDFPKKMHWGDREIAYARPLRWLVALYGEHIIPFHIDGIYSGRISQGHRQMSPGDVTIAKAKDYFAALHQRRVMVDIAERKRSIEEQLVTLEKQLGGEIVARERVIPQVIHLVEWPTLTAANFDPSFLAAPKEVLISEMVEHQRYFPVANKDGTLKNSFVITSDTQPTDRIRAGNQRVLTPRLSDGVFLYEQDLKTDLQQMNEKLKSITFLKGLGTVYDKVERLIAHVEVLHQQLPIAPLDKAKRAALLCKADLASKMVYEFPELQGVMGELYALAKGEDPEIAHAINQHWMPRGEHAPLPEEPVAILVSLADKIDNMISCFIADLKPTSSSDPYALRRQMLGIIKILIQGEHHLSMMDVFRACFAHFPAHQKQKEQILQEIEQFILNRIRTVFLDYGFHKDEIEASLSGGSADIYDLFCKVKALHEFRQADGKFGLLFEVYKRAKGQLSQHQNGEQAHSFSTALLVEPAEKNLDTLLSQLQNRFTQSVQMHHYDAAYGLVAQVQPALATLFDQVKILSDDPKIRQNRLALLNRVFSLFDQLLDFSKIQDISK